MESENEWDSEISHAPGPPCVSVYGEKCPICNNAHPNDPRFKKKV